MPHLVYHELSPGDPLYEEGYRWEIVEALSRRVEARFKSRAAADNWFDFMWGTTMVTPDKFLDEEYREMAMDALRDVANRIGPGVTAEQLVGLLK